MPTNLNRCEPLWRARLGNDNDTKRYEENNDAVAIAISLRQFATSRMHPVNRLKRTRKRSCIEQTKYHAKSVTRLECIMNACKKWWWEIKVQTVHKKEIITMWPGDREDANVTLRPAVFRIIVSIRILKPDALHGAWTKFLLQVLRYKFRAGLSGEENPGVGGWDRQVWWHFFCRGFAFSYLRAGRARIPKPVDAWNINRWGWASEMVSKLQIPWPYLAFTAVNRGCHDNPIGDRSIGFCRFPPVADGGCSKKRNLEPPWRGLSTLFDYCTWVRV